MNERCPWCLEPLASAKAAACERCRRPLVDDQGLRLRPIDLRYDSIVAKQRQSLFRYLTWGTPAAALLSLASPFVTGPLHFVVSVPVLVIAHGITQHLTLLRRPRGFLGRRRHFLSRTTFRLAFYPAALFGYAHGVIPFAGAVLGALTFGGLSLLANEHVMWSLRLERERKPLTRTEKFFFAVVVFLDAFAEMGPVRSLAGAFEWVARRNYWLAFTGDLRASLRRTIQVGDDDFDWPSGQAREINYDH